MNEYYYAAIYDTVKKLIKTPEIKDGTYLIDWISEGDLFGMEYQMIADEWDALPAMETDDNTPH